MIARVAAVVPKAALAAIFAALLLLVPGCWLLTDEQIAMIATELAVDLNDPADLAGIAASGETKGNKGQEGVLTAEQKERRAARLEEQGDAMVTASPPAARDKYNQALSFADTNTEGGRARAASINGGIASSYRTEAYMNVGKAGRVNDPESKAGLLQLARQKDLQAADYAGRAAALEPDGVTRGWHYGNQATSLGNAGDKAGACTAQTKAVGADPTASLVAITGGVDYCK